MEHALHPPPSPRLPPLVGHRVSRSNRPSGDSWTRREGLRTGITGKKRGRRMWVARRKRGKEEATPGGRGKGGGEGNRGGRNDRLAVKQILADVF